MQGLATLSGGIFYHYLGFRYSGKLWKPTRDFISEQLKQFVSQHQGNILLVGPSASYLLNENVLKSIRNLICVDIDPVAPVLFKQRHGVKAHWLRQNVFSSNNVDLDIEKTRWFVEAHPTSAIVFCNILGQLPFLYPATWRNPEKLSLWKSDFHKLMDGRAVFSFHDRLTMTGASKPVLKTLKHSMSLPNEELISKISSASSEVIDHETAGIVRGVNNTYCVWSMTPQEHHILECSF